MRRSRDGGDLGSGLSIENHKAIGFLCNSGPDSLENRKALNGVSLAGL